MRERAVRESRQSNLPLWFGLLSGPIVYSVYFVAGYLFAEMTCMADALRFRVLGLEAISFAIVMLTMVAAAITGYSTVLAYRAWQHTRGDEESARGERSYRPFMAFVGAWLSGLFTLFILLTAVPAFFLLVCDWV